jgi:hypothetical protein
MPHGSKERGTDTVHVALIRMLHTLPDQNMVTAIAICSRRPKMFTYADHAVSMGRVQLIS